MTMVDVPAATFSVTGGLAAEYAERGEMIPWQGVLVVEGAPTGDMRYIETGALTHRTLPLPFMVQLTNPVGGEGHDGASLTGRIDSLTRLNDGQWLAAGFIDPTMADGATLAMALDKQLIRGISVDLDQVSVTEVQGKDGKPRQVITAARIIGGTATPFQAFAECEIALNVDKMATALAASADLTELFDFAVWDAELTGMIASVWTPVDGIETLVAFAGSAIPVDPPLAWFERRKFTETTPLTVLANGQVFGHIASWGTCHISFANRCVPVPRSHTNYAKFRNGSTLTAEGTMVRTGPMIMDTIHPDTRWKAKDAQAFYADTGAAVCDVVPYEDEFGIAVVGAMRPDVTPARMRAFRGSDISPDWRNIDGYRLECCALLAVNNSGFKLSHALVASAGMAVEPGSTAISLDAFDEIYALVASGPMRVEPCCEACAGHTPGDVDVESDATVTASGSLDDASRAARLAAVQTRFGVSRDQRLASFRQRFTPPAPPPPRNFRVADSAGPADEAQPTGLRQFRDTDGTQARDDSGRWTDSAGGSTGKWSAADHKAWVKTWMERQLAKPSDEPRPIPPLTDPHGVVIDYGEGEWPTDAGSWPVIDEELDVPDPATGQTGDLGDMRPAIDVAHQSEIDTAVYDKVLRFREAARKGHESTAAKAERMHEARRNAPGTSPNGTLEGLDPSTRARIDKLFAEFWDLRDELDDPGFDPAKFTVRTFRVADGALVAFAPDQPRDYHGRWTDGGGQRLHPNIVRRLVHGRRGRPITVDQVRPGMILDSWDGAKGVSKDGEVTVKGRHKVLSIEPSRDELLRVEKSFMLDLLNVESGQIVESVKLHAKASLSRPYIAGMDDQVTVYVPPAAVHHKHRKLGYMRTFRVAFRDLDGTQPRDDHGRWTDTGGAPARIAREVRAHAEQHIDTVTQDIRSIVESNGGSMRGLRSRLKGVKSLARKIHDKAEARGLTLEESAARLTDAMRFTAVVDNDSYTKLIRELQSSLPASGYVPADVENHWMRGDAYNGVHMLVKGPNNTVAELQVHTPESLRAKNKIHRAYEIYRDPATPEAVARKLFADMVAISDAAPLPRDVLEIQKIVRRPHEPRSFLSVRPTTTSSGSSQVMLHLESERTTN